jgi:hypothetical protein
MFFEFCLTVKINLKTIAKRNMAEKTRAKLLRGFTPSLENGIVLKAF